MSDSPSQSQPGSIPPQLPGPSFITVDNAATEDCDVIVVGLVHEAALPPTVAALDTALGRVIGAMLSQGKLSAEVGESMLIAGPGAVGSGPRLVLLLGLGDAKKLDRGSAVQIGSTAARALISKPHDKWAVTLPESFAAEHHDAIVAGLLMGLEGQAIYRTKPANHVPDTIAMASCDASAVQRGVILGDSINLTRRLINEPASAIYPESLAERAAEMARSVSLECEIWDEAKLAEENCRAILAVGAGSARPPRLLILRHNGGQPDEAPLAIVGKGVTFDSGGLSIKPSDGMADMKCDMGGAATVIGTMHAIAKLGIKKNVIGLCGMAENMLSGTSYKLGDVIETRSGKTIEILNTDAEGRVVLSDTLNVAIGYQPAAMVDLATLTGACMVALGNEVAGVMTNNQSACDAVLSAADGEGELLWQLPMFELYDEKVKSKVADIKNVGEGRWGGAITAAKFLENFVGDTPWVHIDIAGPAYADSPKPHRDAGATGAMVRTLVRWIEQSSSTS